MTELALEWRPMREEDRNYVLSSWLRSYIDSRPSEFRQTPRGVYFALYEPIVKRLMERSTVAIASTPDLPDTVLGFLVVEGASVVHYVHTKQRFRKCGIGRWMTRDLAAFPAVFTHEPSATASRLCGPEWVFDGMRRFEKRAA